MTLVMRLLALLGVLGAIFDGAVADNSIVSTKSGDVRGVQAKSFLGNEYFSFKGIPYAEPPLGPMRFRAPQPHPGWTGVRDAKDHGDVCLQYDMFAGGVMAGSEDCLFVNVYTPSLPTSDKHPDLPVMVWIHGGGFINGYGDAEFYGPDYFMDEQVVLVTLNYRLGPFGFLTTADAHAPGNYGLHDQVLALEWVQANIEAFGGNRDDVTIFGESAGGASVGLQVLSPRSRGLFAKAISQSGASFCSFGASGEPQGQMAREHAEVLNCDTTSSLAVVDCLRQKPAEEVLSAMSKFTQDALMGMAILYKPRVDAESPSPFLPENPYVVLKEGRFSRVPWMNGLNSEEGALTVALHAGAKKAPPYQSRDWNVWAKELLEITKVTADPAAVAQRIYKYYFGDDAVTDANRNLLADMLSDRMFASCVLSEVDLASAHTDVYSYVLDHKGVGRQSFTEIMTKVMGMEDSKDLGVAHADDLLYLFKPEFVAPITPDSDEYKIIRLMVSLWTNFARRGYPSTDVVPMPSWPVYTASRQEHMRLNLAPSVGRAAFSVRMQFWQQLDIQENWRQPQMGQRRDEL
ncbi:venom carboxylesterase-6-like [Pollicipes pollicipes]|uniref:venom carboxylesterase-6-like n=1 Tax=Pollicipes pollicipes TaxID=41117 RepID=UPI0018853B01|nr:venom carboxylesterase-6-like [Pollicipes pollicipes]